MREYPLVLLSSEVEQAKESLPPLPAKPSPPSKPVLNLPLEPIHPGEFQLSEPRRFDALVLIVGGVLVAFLTAIFKINGFFIGALLLGALASWYHVSYPERLQTYRKAKEAHELKVAQHPAEVQNWKSQAETTKRYHNIELQQWQAEVDRIDRGYERDVLEFRTPQAIDIYQKALIQQILLQSRSYDDTDSDAPQGYAEYPHNCSLGPKLKQYFPSKIHAGLKVGDCTPDFAYIDPATGLHIDIEIDEPYTPRQYPNGKPLTLTHCIDSDDRNRDRFFKSRGWVVIRFSEEQVLCWTDSCVKEVAKVVADLTGDTSIMSPFTNVPDLNPMPCWNEMEARQMAERRARLNYRTTSAPRQRGRLYPNDF